MILDEEQRFGVAQKELLQSLRLEVDVLTLSATPIPRTLHMSLAGLRDISVIETPPEGRRPIRTHRRRVRRGARQAGARARAGARRAGVLPPQPRRDDRRGAPRSCSSSARSCASSSRTGRCASASSRRRCTRFLRGDADVLVSTTIIESGLDIPQANTLIVERADTLGLAQLYQIRGRVGRSDATAYAYLFYPDARELTPEARARLATLADHTELGAGFAIAMRDLEIRGAGDLLGAEQSGPRRRARLRALRRAAERGRRRAVRASGGSPRGRSASTRASTPTCPPPTSAPRRCEIDLHRRLALAETEDELRELQAALEDRYGPLPEPVENLFAIQEAKLKLARARRRLPRLPRRQARRSAGSSSARASCGSCATASRPRSTPSRSQEVTLRSQDGFSAGGRPGRCYLGRAPGGLRSADPAPGLLRHRPHWMDMKTASLSCSLPLLLAVGLLAAGCGGGSQQACRRTPSPSSARDTITEDAVQRPARRGEGELQGAEADVPEGGHRRSTSRSRPGGQYLVQASELEQKAKELGITVTDKEVDDAAREDQEAVLRRRREEVPGAAEEQGLTEAAAASTTCARRLALREALRQGHRGREGHRPARSQAYYKAHHEQYAHAADARRRAHPRRSKAKALADKL